MLTFPDTDFPLAGSTSYPLTLVVCPANCRCLRMSSAACISCNFLCFVQQISLALHYLTLLPVFIIFNFIFLSAVAYARNRLSSLVSPDLPAVAADPCAASTARLYGTCVQSLKRPRAVTYFAVCRLRTACARHPNQFTSDINT